MILEPLYRYWAIPEKETVSGYGRAFANARFNLTEIEDLSAQALRALPALCRRPAARRRVSAFFLEG